MKEFPTWMMVEPLYSERNDICLRYISFSFQKTIESVS